jgi:hypothetical protein
MPDLSPESGFHENRGMQMLQFDQDPQLLHLLLAPLCRSKTASPTGHRSLEARVKPECVDLYPGVDPQQWYRVVQEGEYKDEMEGLWIQVTDWVTYVLAKHFDLQSRPEVH